MLSKITYQHKRILDVAQFSDNIALFQKLLLVERAVLAILTDPYNTCVLFNTSLKAIKSYKAIYCLWFLTSNRLVSMTR